MANNRDIGIDVLKGLGIILMVIGHVNAPCSLLENFIYSFHMPLFFLISGYLYKEKSFKTLIYKNAKKVLIPYFATGCFIWFVYVILYKRYDWGISLLLGNGSAPVWNYNEYYVGPLWFLLCYFISVIAFHLILKIKQEIVQFFLLAFLFIISLFYKCKYGLLPFDLLNSIPATICLWIGYQLRSPLSRRIVFSRCALLIGSVVWIICVLYSELSMASHIYKLYFFDLLGALYGTILVYFFINWVCETSIMFKNILVLVGKYSLLFLAIHSVDIMLYISDRIIIYSQIDKLDGSIVFILNVLLKLFILFLGYLVISHTPILRKVFIYD